MNSAMDRFFEEEDELILILKQRGHSWVENSDCISGRDCRERLRTHVSEKEGKKWVSTASEDQLLSAFGTQIKHLNWDFISRWFEDRIASACRSRWSAVLMYSPEENAKPWTEDEIQQLQEIHGVCNNWHQISKDLSKATGQPRKAGECLRWWLQSRDAFAYPSPVALSHRLIPERKELVERLRGAGETWEHIAKQVSSIAVPPDLSHTVVPFPDDCRNSWYNTCWGAYHLWVRADGKLNLKLYDNHEGIMET